MLCPNCGNEFRAGKTCPYCGIDAVLFTGTLKISDFLYNRGLARAKAGDLSGAAECLQKSVQVNKNNVVARNLMGLTLFEMGRVGDALKEWVISQSLSKEQNPAAGYLETMNQNGQLLEMANDAVRMYNKALEYVHQKSDDLAIIQLKKAVDLNPKFIDALNLLTLCYLIQRDRDKAQHTVERVLSLDVNNTIALNYYAELFPGRVRPDVRVRRNGSGAQPSPFKQPFGRPRLPMADEKRTNFHVAEILAFIIGAACMFAALYVLVIPAIERDRDRQIDAVTVQQESLRADQDDQIKDLQNTIQENEDLIGQLQTQVDSNDTQSNVIERMYQVMRAYGELMDGNPQAAVDGIADMDVTGLPTDIGERAEHIKETAYPMLAQEYYGTGVQAYDTDADYAKAVTDLSSAWTYAENAAVQTGTEMDIAPDILYYLGRAYAQDADSAAEAVETLSTLRDRYPDHPHARDAESLLDELQGG